MDTACVHSHLQHASDAQLGSHLQFAHERHTIRGIVQRAHDTVLKEDHVKQRRQDVHSSGVSQYVGGLPLQHVHEV